MHEFIKLYGRKIMISEKDYLQFNFINKKNVSYLVNNNLNCKVELIKIPTESTSSFCTKNSNEILVVVEGNGGIVINGNSSLVKNGDIIHIPSNSVRSISNLECQNLQVVSIRNR
jgi:mannose-6-phosphate isomerase-like protein (cupin superfamily)